jgi:hypothetical protein
MAAVLTVRWSSKGVGRREGKSLRRRWWHQPSSPESGRQPRPTSVGDNRDERRNRCFHCAGAMADLSFDCCQPAADKPLTLQGVKAMGGRSNRQSTDVSILSTAVSNVNHFGYWWQLISSTSGSSMDLLQRRRRRILRSLEVVVPHVAVLWCCLLCPHTRRC